MTDQTDIDRWHHGEISADRPTPVIAIDVLDRYVRRDIGGRHELTAWARTVAQGAHLQTWIALYTLARLPAELGRLIRDAPRGAAICTHWWWRWVTGARQTRRLALAVNAADVAAAYEDQRRDRVLGSIVSVASILCIAGFSWWGWAQSPLRTILAWVFLAAAFGCVARIFQGRPILTPAAVPTSRAVTSPAIIDAFTPITGKTAVTVLGTPHRQGDGWYATVELPPGTEVGTIIRRKATIAGGLKVAEDRVTIDPLPLASADQIGLYVADRHPLEVEVGSSPVLDADTVDLWQGVPLGPSATGLVVLSLAESHVLISGATGSGKTHVARNLINAVLRDPHAEPIEWDFKGDGDFTVYRNAMRVAEGDDEETVTAFAEWLQELRKGVMPRRAAMLRRLVESGATDQPKLTRRMAAELGVPLILAHVDEVQIPLGWGGPVGKQIADDLLHVARTGRSKGVRLALSTQRPDSDALESALRAQLPARVCLRVDNADASRMALGVRADSGWDADRLPATPGAAIALGPGILPGPSRFRCFPSDLGDARTVVGRCGRTATPLPEPAKVGGAVGGELPDVLATVEAVWPNPGRDAHSDVLAVHAGWERAALVKALRGLGLEHRTVYMPRPDGSPRQKGFALADVEAAIARYRSR